MPAPPRAAIGAPSSNLRGSGARSLAQVVAGWESQEAWPFASRPQEPLQHAWSEFLTGFDWQWFATMTFSQEVHPEKADKLFRLWCALLDESNLGVGRWSRKSNRKRRCTWVRGLEWQKRGVLHYHALIGNLPAYTIGANDRLLWAEKWLALSADRSGKPITGISRIWPLTDTYGAASYVSKYCAKGGQVDVSSNLSLLSRGSNYVHATVKQGSLPV